MKPETHPFLLGAMPLRITPCNAYPLHGADATRAVEMQLANALPEHALMQRAGNAVARLARALAPHAERIWVACGPGNNGGDGLEAAALLASAGIKVAVTLFGNTHHRRPDGASVALLRAQAAGVHFADAAPAGLTTQDLCIDALLGTGTRKVASNADAKSTTTNWLPSALHAIRRCGAPILAIDLPSGLHADTGSIDSNLIAENSYPDGAEGIFLSRFTLSLLTLKPGLFTAQGRDAAGEIWFSDLRNDPSLPQNPAPISTVEQAQADVAVNDAAQRFTLDTSTPATPTAPIPIVQVARDAPTAILNAPPHARMRPMASHKGCFGDVAVIGGEGITRRGMGMCGAAVLAATAAVNSGAGRVMLALLCDDIAGNAAAPPADIMLRRIAAIDLSQATVVCGCGGGEAIQAVLPQVLRLARALVLDADALNAIAKDAALQALLIARPGSTILTPHPLEAARLLGFSSALAVQSDRLAAADALVQRYRCVVVLKGSGTIVARSGHLPVINPTGNGRLAIGGTGDVLAGMIGAALAATPADALGAAAAAVYRHGAYADAWPINEPLTAQLLARRGGLGI